MTAGRAIPILIFTLLSAGCADTRGRAMKTLQRYKPERLRKEVALYYKDAFAQHQLTSVSMPPKYWSEAFSALQPERITAYPDGFAFCLEINGDAESGLYIVPQGMDVQPKQTAWASYEKLHEGIYWYSFKP